MPIFRGRAKQDEDEQLPPVPRPGPDEWKALLKNVRECERRLSLETSGLGRLSKKQMIKLAEAIKGNKNISSLHLDNNELNKLKLGGWQKLAEAITDHPKIEILSLRHNELGKLSLEKMNELVRAINPEKGRIKALFLEKNKLGELEKKVAQSLAGALRGGKLKMLMLDDNDLGDLVYHRKSLGDMIYTRWYRS